MSENPVLGGPAETTNAKSKAKGQAYAPLREQIVYSEFDKLVLDLDDLDLVQGDRKSTRLNSSHSGESRMPSSA